MTTLTDRARLLEIHNALADALMTHNVRGWLTLCNCDRHGTDLELILCGPAIVPFLQDVRAILDEYDFQLGQMKTDNTDKRFRILLLPSLTELGSPIPDTL